jgi:hypothetical protein
MKYMKDLTTSRQLSKKTQRQYIYDGTREAKTGYVIENKTISRMPPGRPRDEWNSRMRECGIGLDIQNVRPCQGILQEPHNKNNLNSS